MNTEKILAEHFQKTTLITSENIMLYTFPKIWNQIFYADDFETKKNMVINIWNSCFEIELRRTISFISQNLISIEFVENNFGVSMVYIMKEDDRIVCMESYLPITNLNDTILNHLPQKVLFFYSIFNGWTMPETQFMGLLPLESIKPFFEEHDDDYPKFKDFIVIFKNGGGGYLCFDKKNINNAIVWWSDDVPMVNINLWDFLDEWILMGLTE